MSGFDLHVAFFFPRKLTHDCYIPYHKSFLFCNVHIPMKQSGPRRAAISSIVLSLGTAEQEQQSTSSNATLFYISRCASHDLFYVYIMAFVRQVELFIGNLKKNKDKGGNQINFSVFFFFFNFNRYRAWEVLFQMFENDLMYV